MSTEAERHYEGKGITEEDLNSELDALWSQIQDPNSKLSQEAQASGIDVAQLRGKRREEFIVTRTEGAGSGAEWVSLIVAFAPLVVKIAGSLWDHVFLRRINQKHRGDALIPKDEE
jgi:hypothetical protein